MATIRIENLTHWSPQKRVETRQGPRLLRTGEATQLFWRAWKSSKTELKAAGVSCGKDRRTGQWEAKWWQPLSEKEVMESEEAQEASRAVDASVDLPVPEGLEYLPFQRAGIAYALDRPNVLIADEMGLGKTIQAIGVHNADPTIKKTIVICPASLRLNWQREFSKWATRPVTVAVVQGGKATDFPQSEFDVLVINYDVVKKHRERIDAHSWDLLIVDEAHYLKNGKAARTKAVLGSKTKTATTAGIKAGRRVFLSGTPLVNRPVELWSLVEALDPEDLGKSFFGFAKRYCNAHQGRWGWDFTGASNLSELQRRLRERLMVRRLKSEVLTELPAKRRQILEIPANGATSAVRAEREAAQRHEEVLHELQAMAELAKASENPEDYENAVRRLREGLGVAFTELSKARHAVALAKVPHVVEHLRSALEEGPVVVFAHHKDVVAAIAEEFEGSVTITGSTKLEDRQAAVDAFQGGQANLFVGNLQAAGVGITLVRSSHVVFAELDWVPGNLSQAEDRCHRIGQDQSVLVQHLVLQDSLDARMAQTVIEKQQVIDRALDHDVQQLPAAPTREQATTVEITPGELADAGAQLAPETVAAIHLATRQLASMCDGAREEDGAGYNKIDTRIGKALAAEVVLRPRQAALAQKIIRKYRRQLSDDLLAAAGVVKKA